MKISEAPRRIEAAPRPSLHVTPDAARLYAASLSWLLGVVAAGHDVPSHMLAHGTVTDELVTRGLWARTATGGIEVTDREFVQRNRVMRSPAA